MIYYSTGLGKRLKKRGAILKDIPETTAVMLLRKGLIVKSLSDLEEKVIDIPDSEIIVENEVKVKTERTVKPKTEKPVKPKVKKPVEKKKAVKTKK